MRPVPVKGLYRPATIRTLASLGRTPRVGQNSMIADRVAGAVDGGDRHTGSRQVNLGDEPLCQSGSHAWLGLRGGLIRITSRRCASMRLAGLRDHERWHRQMIEEADGFIQDHFVF